MTWARFDDLYDDNRKVKRAWRRHPRAVGLHAMAVTYSSRHETDGLVDIDWFEEKLPKATERAAVLKVLVDVGLFIEVDDEHYRVHDYLDFNPSKAALEAKREADAARKRKPPPSGVREESERSPDGGNAESNGTPSDASRDARTPAPAARPGPSRPALKGPPSPPDGGRARDRKGWETEAVKYARLAGVDGDEETLCRAVEQATSYVKLKSPEEFRTFAAQHFESLTVEVAAA